MIRYRHTELQNIYYTIKYQRYICYLGYTLPKIITFKINIFQDMGKYVADIGGITTAGFLDVEGREKSCLNHFFMATWVYSTIVQP